MMDIKDYSRTNQLSVKLMQQVPSVLDATYSLCKSIPSLEVDSKVATSEQFQTMTKSLQNMKTGHVVAHSASIGSTTYQTSK